MDDALELMYFGWRGMTLAADEYLGTLGLSRAHHRNPLRHCAPARHIGRLPRRDHRRLQQALNRPLNLLLRRDLVISVQSSGHEAFTLGA
ncbi:hypothetical protein [Bradyrhizobium algeriense]|uniref:hypothetical protein n=1 Tax=Bradyrhizobium algeriense TaxID=634784 RepID=UPI002FF29583